MERGISAFHGLFFVFRDFVHILREKRKVKKVKLKKKKEKRKSVFLFLNKLFGFVYSPELKKMKNMIIHLSI